MIRDLLNIAIALFILILCAPFMLILGALIKLDTPGPIFYMQKRVGINGKEFEIFKFRSMRANTVGLNLTSGNADPRITMIGKYIRKFHMDEFAQLINVAKGEMHLIGPRPEVPEYVKYYPEKWALVLSVKPGITGLSAVKCADEEYAALHQSADPSKTYVDEILPKKLDVEIDYIEHRSLKLDLKIIYLTIMRILGMSKKSH